MPLPMHDNQRAHEALSLRLFFDEQIQHMQHLLANLSSHLHLEDHSTAEDKQIVEVFVDEANNKMRAVHGYAEKLRDHVKALYSHVLQVADEIPQPVALTPQAFTKDPLLNALFVDSTDIDKLFHDDVEINHFLQQNDKPLYGLLTANLSEKNTLGVGLMGDMLIHEVPQHAVNFSAHKIVTPCNSPDELNSALKRYLFDHVVALVKQEMTIRLNDSLLHTGDSYQSRINSLANPDVYLNTLLEYLQAPDSLLSIDKTHYKLSKLGIKLAETDKQIANEFDIHQLTWFDNSRNVVLPIVHNPRIGS
jgi:hypothetical protein